MPMTGAESYINVGGWIGVERGYWMDEMKVKVKRKEMEEGRLYDEVSFSRLLELLDND